VHREVCICLAASVFLAVAACTDDTNGGAKEPARPRSEEPIAGGNAVVGVLGEPPTLDPYAPDATDLTRALVRPVYPSLFRVGPNGAIVPDLATDMNAFRGRAVVRLAPRRWSNGRGITARDVVATVLRAIPPSGFARVRSARAVSRRIVQLRGPVQNWRATLASSAFVLPGGRPSEPGGAFGGPYVIRKVVPGLEVVYARNPQWEQAPYLRRLTVTYVTSLLMMTRLLEDGRLDAAAIPSSVNLDERLEEMGLNYDSALGYETVVLDFSSSGLSRAERAGIANRLPIRLMQEGLIRDDGRVARSLYPTPKSAAGPFGREFGRGAIPEGPVLLLAPSGDELLQLIQRVIDARLDERGVNFDLVRLVPSDLYGGTAPVSGVEVRRVAGGPGGDDARTSRRRLDRYPLFQVETLIAWRSGLHDIQVNPTFEGPLDGVHEWWWSTGRRSEAGL
jgi:hypothetical protein